MSSEDQDQVRPFHAKKEASGQEAADAVAAVLKHAAQHEAAAQEKTRPKKQPKWMLPLGINLAIFALYLLIAPPAWVTVHPIKAPPPAEQARSLRVAMYLQASRIEAYRNQHGSLPDSLPQAGSATPGITYTRVGLDSYELVGTNGGATLEYDSSQSLAAFGGPAVGRLSGG